MRISDWSSDVCSSDLMDEQPADRCRDLFAERVVDIEDGNLHVRGGERLGGRATEPRCPARYDCCDAGIDFHGEAPQAGIWLKGMPLSGRWSCGRPRMRSAIVLSNVSSDPPAMRPVGALIQLDAQSSLDEEIGRAHV